MQELVVATNNKGKIAEISAMINNFDLLSLNDIHFTADIPEPYDTFEENAFTKAHTIFSYCGKNVMSDDSGLCIDALNGQPGVDSAHYSGKRDDEANLQKVLSNIEHKTNRNAYYKAVICLIWNGQPHYFEGICNGTIAYEKKGNGGFGYDPIFIPNGYSQTFGELDASVKHSISHRGIAVSKMIAFIKEKLAD